MHKCESLKITRIGKSAAKARIEQGSTTSKTYIYIGIEPQAIGGSKK